MDDRILAAWRLLPGYLSQHVLLSLCALGIGFAVSLPLAVAASRSATVRWPSLFVASLIQTIPSLALLALFYPLLLALSALTRSWFGWGFAALGFLPSVMALTLYSMLPILRNGVAGLRGVDPAVMEAARGIGLTGSQQLLWVQLPLSAPVIMAGVRTAAVWTIGAATLATPVGQTCLGNYIFQGLQTENWVFVLFGCAAAAILALAADQLLGLIEAGLTHRRRSLILVGSAGLVVGSVVALLPIFTASSGPVYRIGAKNFAEQYILARVMADRVGATGAKAVVSEDLGSATAYRALAAGEIDAYVDYTGTLWTNVLGRHDNPGREAMLAGVKAALMRRDGVRLFGPLGYENAYVLAMRPDRAQALGIGNLADLAAKAPSLRFGADLEFLSRPEWTALRQAYGLGFGSMTSYQPTFMYRSLEDGSVDVISAFSSDGRIAADHLVVLSDPKQALPPYDAVILLAPGRAEDTRLAKAFTPLIGAISVGAMRQANYSVDRPGDKLSIAAAARQLELGLKQPVKRGAAP
jgi:osmoprotectant transport system permease protein